MKKLLIFLLILIYSSITKYTNVDVNEFRSDHINVTVIGTEKDKIYQLKTFSTLNDLITILNLDSTYDLTLYNPSMILKDNDVITFEKIKDDRISINTSNIEQLDQLPGIGESTAKKIIEYRNKNGLFHNIEDLMKIEGIKQSKFEKLKDYIKL